MEEAPPKGYMFPGDMDPMPKRATDEEIRKALDGAVSLIGPNQDGNVRPPIYEFLRRYGPMRCVDVVLVPEGDSPGVILAKRNNKGVAPNQLWIFGGRVDKILNYVRVAEQKVKSEIGLDVLLSPADIIGEGRTIFPPNELEATLRDYTISTPNLCLAKQVPLTSMVQQKIKPADGHEPIWTIAERLDAGWHPYIVHAVANAWRRFYGMDWAKETSDDVRRILRDESHFIPLRYEPLEI
jgi:hypothetical protein